MVDFAANGGADVVVVQYLNRFGRNPREILRRYWDLEERGVQIVTTSGEGLAVAPWRENSFAQNPLVWPDSM